MDRIARIIEQMKQLSPAERRQLFRRAQVTGLLSREELLTDRNALKIAPAVQRPPYGTYQTEATDVPLSENGKPAASAAVSTSTTYRSPISGRVVVGSPQDGAEQSLSTMRPLPGQAPDKPIRIVFDGGSKGNPGRGYGSYALDWPGHPRQVVRLQFGNQVTNNEAEYDTLIAALEAVLKRLAEMGAAPQNAQLEIWGDSQLVINQVNGDWQASKPELQIRRDRAQSLLAKFRRRSLRHHSRQNNVEILGH